MSEVVFHTPDLPEHSSEVLTNRVARRRILGEAALEKTEADRSFGSYIEPMIPLIASVARNILRNSADTEDIVQEVLLKGWHMFQNGERPTKGWFATVTRTTVIDKYRREGRRPDATPVDFTDFESQSLHPSYPFEESLKRELLNGEDAFIQFIITVLTTKQLSGEELLDLLVQIGEGQKSSEYAEQHNMTANMTRRHLYIARQRLKKYEDIIRAYIAGEDITLAI